MKNYKKVTIQTGPDVALIKYWGKKDEKLRLPENGSISFKLDGLNTITTVQFDPGLTEDVVKIDGKADSAEVDRVVEHLDRIRQLAGENVFARVTSVNDFPKGTGLSSSGSGFAALTVAGTKSIGLDLSEKELSILARHASGTSCRCICGGFVEWRDGDSSESSYSQSIFPSDYLDIRDVVVVVEEGMKKTSSTKGHELASSSPFFKVRQEKIQAKIEQMKTLLENKDFSKLGLLAEQESLEFHSILLTSQPSIIAWYPGTVQVMHEVQKLREEGILCFFTMSTGFNVHVLTLPEFESKVSERMEELSLVTKVLSAKVGGAPIEITNHLF